jgi:excisionase family DNA binding protein
MVEKLLTAKDVGEQLGIADWHVLELARDGKIRSIRIGYRTIRFAQEEVDRFIKDWQNPKVKNPVFGE